MRMSNESSDLRKTIEAFKLSTRKISEKVNGVSEIWKDQSYANLQEQMGVLAKNSRAVIEYGDKTCASVDKFFEIASEKI